MIARKRGAIVNIASIAAFHVTVPHVPYAASKAGVVALTRDLAYEVGRHGIRVNAIAPGPIDTPMARFGTEEERAAAAKNILLGRMGALRTSARRLFSSHPITRALSPAQLCP